MRKVYTVLEYTSIIKGKTLPNDIFTSLENFILSNNEISEFMNISIKKGLGKIITVKNYVGIISTKDGSTIEILPKVCPQNDIPHIRKVFLNMLKTTKDIPFKNIQKGYIKTDNISMLDIFIQEFLCNLESTLLCGIKSKYITIEENSKYLRGKLNYSKQFKYNSTRKDRFYINHDVFTLNNPENRLIKSTLILLKKFNVDSFRLQKILSKFDTIEISKNYLQDFNNCTIKSYNDILKWCRVFLMGNGFTPFAKDYFTYALLFPMEKIFEKYVSSLVKKSSLEYTVKIQSRDKYLVDNPKKFMLIPDIILENSNNIIILDVKWKVLNIHAKNYGISQQDMYQMFVYAKRFNSKRVILIYPLCDNVFLDKNITFQIDDITIEIKFITL